ncbi:hypothetical protein [Actinoallomurus soli]|uniref:hypothetical protein n=1 Tax=Actinoallomurus soli TaxID=2952535 RepID=UPI0020929838|nr:hypothetical protein [Actinoallomurus soli]MCO5968594.1 hypothetical protein [Actinoallomurus soli]
MDEVRMVRDAYPEPAPPTAREIARAKALLARPPRRTPSRLWWGLGGVVAAGTAATVAITLAGGDTSVGGNTPAPGRTVTLDGRSAFLAAVEKAAQQPIGNYWHSDDVLGQSYVIRAKTGTYAITGALTEGFDWWGTKSGAGNAFYSRELPARPTTARDTALWRKAGSPSDIRVWSSDHYWTYRTDRVTKWHLDDEDSRFAGPLPGGLTVRDLQNLPADPDELAKRFLSQKAMSRAMVGVRPGVGVTPEMARRLKSLRVPPTAALARVSRLLRAPLPSKVRAGLMRALADQPGIHSIGHDTDALGRPGVALATDYSPVTVTGEYGAPKAVRGTYRSRSVAIFDERTGALLGRQEELTTPGGPYAEMRPGFIINYSVIRSAGWTDTAPKPPADLPFGRP